MIKIRTYPRLMGHRLDSRCSAGLCASVVGLAFCLLSGFAMAREAPKPVEGGRDRQPESNDVPAGREAILAEAAKTPIIGQPPSALPLVPVYPIDLTTSLRLAESENPEIAEARAAIGVVLAELTAARVLLLPTLNTGMSYHFHDGVLQRSSGKILSLTQQSLYVGGGAMAVTAGTVAIPAVQLFSPLTDAIFEPLAARQRLDVARFDARTTANDVLLDVAVLYLGLQGAEYRLAAQRRTADDAAEVARLNVAYSKVGLRTPADAERSLTRLALFQAYVRRGEEDVAVSSALLARRLHLDPSIRLQTNGEPLQAITLIDPSADRSALIQYAIRRRPEVGSRAAAVAERTTRLREEQARPLLPTISVGYSGAAFGGGSNLEPPTLGRFAGRTDFDVVAYWTLLNGGMGNLAIQRGRRAQIGQAEADRQITINRVRREVLAANAMAAAKRAQIAVTRKQRELAESGYQRDLMRARGAVGRPIEVLNNLMLLAQGRLNEIQAIIDYDQAEFRLFVALGSPPPLPRPATGPIPPAPIAKPPLEAVAPMASLPH